MSDQTRHEMVLKTTYSSGEEEWYCPTCGRRMTITWQPWKKVILDPGDIYAAHGGSKGILKLGPLQINQKSEHGPLLAPKPSREDRYLTLWKRWLDTMDWNNFDNEDAP